MRFVEIDIKTGQEKPLPTVDPNTLVYSSIVNK